MSKITITFELNEEDMFDKLKFKALSKLDDLLLALYKIDELMYRNSEDETDELQKLKREIRSIYDVYQIDINELII